MNTYRRTAVGVGVLFIIGTVAGMISLGVFTDPILGAPHYLSGVSANETRVLVGALLELVMGVALVGMAVAVYPVLAKFGVPMAIGYLAARIVEFVIYIMGAVSLLTLVTLSRELAGAGAANASYLLEALRYAKEAGICGTIGARSHLLLTDQPDPGRGLFARYSNAVASAVQE